MGQSLRDKALEQFGKILSWGIYTLCAAALPVFGAMAWYWIKNRHLPDWIQLFGRNADLLLIGAALTADAIGRYVQTMKKLPGSVSGSESERIQKIQRGQSLIMGCIGICIINLIAATLFYALVAASLEQKGEMVERIERKIPESTDQQNSEDLQALLRAVREKPVDPTAVSWSSCGTFLVSILFSISAILAERE